MLLIDIKNIYIFLLVFNSKLFLKLWKNQNILKIYNFIQIHKVLKNRKRFCIKIMLVAKY